MMASDRVNTNQDEKDVPIFTAAQSLAFRRKKGALPRTPPPKGVIFCYQRSLVDRLKKNWRLRPVGGFFGDLYLLSATHGQIALAANFGVGAPAAVVLLEELAAFGARAFISLGMAGGLQAELQPGDLVLCARAIRDEGVSRHYLAPGEDALPAPQLLGRLVHALEAARCSYSLGASWTIDAPYREMRSSVERYQKEGVRTVEMEAAALFAAGKCLEVEVAAAFSIADRLIDRAGGLGWQLEFDPDKTHLGLETLFQAAVSALLED